MSINIRQLEAFRAIMITGSVTGASRLLNISQPAVSALLAQLERSLGLNLFIRDRQRLVPTDLARAFVEKVERTFLEFDKLAELAKDLRSLTVRQLRVVLPQAMVLNFVPDVLKRFRLRHPTVTACIEYLPSREAVDMVAAGHFDCGIARCPVRHPGVEAELILQSETVCVLPLGHPLARLETVSPKDLADEQLILQSPRHEARFSINDAFRAEGVEPRIGIETGALTGALAYASAGLGITIVDGLIAVGFKDRGVEVRSFRPPIVNTFAAILPRIKPVPTVAMDFLADLRAVAAETPPFGVSVLPAGRDGA